MTIHPIVYNLRPGAFSAHVLIENMMFDSGDDETEDTTMTVSGIYDGRAYSRIILKLD